jgi:excinuclease ABC subunit A
MALEMDSGTEHVYSNKFACNTCGYSLQELEPRLFSFNNPMGACPSATASVTSSSSIRAHRRLPESVASGAVKGWDRRNQFYFQMLSNLAAFYEFDLDLPFESCREGAGSGAERLGQSRSRSPTSTSAAAPWSRSTFEGVVNNLARRYRETDSMAVKEELAKFINEKKCPSCDGARLRVEARYVKVGSGKQERAIYEIAEKPLRETLSFFEQLKLKGAKKEIADRVVKEIISRLQFLNNVGLDYLSLDRSADTLSGGERSASVWPRRSAPA